MLRAETPEAHLFCPRDVARGTSLPPRCFAAAGRDPVAAREQAGVIRTELYNPGKAGAPRSLRSEAARKKPGRQSDLLVKAERVFFPFSLFFMFFFLAVR